MSQPPPDPAEILLSTADINRATVEGVISQIDADGLIRWAYEQRFKGTLPAEPARPPAPEQHKGFNIVTVLYYFGAMLMISACAWFLGDKWDVLGASGICITAIVYITIAASIGVWLRREGYLVAGGLLITVAVSLLPLLVYSIERMTGWWPVEDPGAYKNFYPLIHGSWIVMELVTIAAAAVTLIFVRFSFLTAPMAFCFWFLSMDLGGLILRQNSLDSEAANWISVLVGAVTIAIGYALDRFWQQRQAPRGEDFAFWCYLFGLMAFWGGLDHHGCRFGVATPGLSTDQFRPRRVGAQIKANRVHGVWCVRHLRLSGSPGMASLQRLGVLPLCSGVVGIEPDSGNGLGTAISAQAHED